MNTSDVFVKLNIKTILKKAVAQKSLITLLYTTAKLSLIYIGC